jgi:hypothetical protein
MSTDTAKAFRQQILKPADGVFLFHARAIERLIEEQLGARVQGVSVPDLPYYLMPKADFLYGLESENAEALSVIEGLRLPNYVILLPSPAEQRLEERGLRRLRYDYWSRAFEAEVARAWQNAREDNQDIDLFGASSLTALIGAHAFAEVRDVLERDGVTLPIWEDDLICRSFVAMVVRLRYFAPGARGFFFPAIRVWPAVDDWLSTSGLDLPEPLQNNRLPMLLMKTRPGAGGDLTAELPLLPTALPFGDSDPDLPRAVQAAQRQAEASLPPVAPRVGGTAAQIAEGERERALEQECLAAMRRGARLRRHPGWLRRLRDDLAAFGRRTLGRILFLPGIEDLGFAGRPDAPDALDALDAVDGQRGDVESGHTPFAGLWHKLGLVLLEQSVALAQRAELNGRFALALLALADARRLAQRLNSPAHTAPAAVEQSIADWEATIEEQLATLLAAKWKLKLTTAAEIRVLIERLAADDRRRFGSPPARLLLGYLEQVLSETRNDYYRLRLGRWLLTLGRARLREVLPFQSLLKALRALELGRARLEDLPWAINDLERFSEALAALTERVTERLDAQITPRLEQAMREADFVPRNHRENVAAQKMRLELLDVIKHRRHLKFTDVRDIVARNILRLPDPSIDEFFRGDRLSRFDRTAARALPGVYRPGELYIKGLQQLGAPLFGTSSGRSILRHLLLPFGGAYLVLKSLDLLIALLPNIDKAFHLTEPVSVLLIGSLINIGVYTGIGRHLALTYWRGTIVTLRFLLYDGVRQLLRWSPVAQLLTTGWVRGLGRNLVAPMLIGTLPLIPIIALAVLVEEVPIEPGLWLAGLAFALGTLARNTPAGRRFLDDLSTNLGRYLRRINQALFIGLIQQLLYFFKEVTRRFFQLLHRVDEALTHHLGERPDSFVLKAVLAPIWRFSEALIQFYVTVLVEPQVNPVKHFPIVTIGHKLLLPFLPAITAAFVDISESILPKFIAYPLVTLTIVLLPGLFGFLVWELKENWKLYQANHRGGLRGKDLDGGDDADLAVEPAVVGTHGETMRALMTRGFHSGALPKGFDRLRKVIRDEIREQAPYPTRLRRVQRQLDEVQRDICVFFEREFTFALREHCSDPNCALQRVETGMPRIATNLVELLAWLHAGGADGTGAAVPEAEAPDRRQSDLPLQLCVRISRQAFGIRFEADLEGAPGAIGPYCWSLIHDDLRLFAGRAGADLRRLELNLMQATEQRAAGPNAQTASQLAAPTAEDGRARRQADVQ